MAAMITVRDLIQGKCKVWTFAPEEPVLRALKLMNAKNIGTVLIMEAEKVVGIFSERDFARKVLLSPNLTVTTPLGELMTTSVYYVGPEQTVDECMALMTEKRIRHLPVIEDHLLVGVISIGDVVKAVIEEREENIKGLEDYLWMNMI
jgi:CBS domain-containing protein